MLATSSKGIENGNRVLFEFFFIFLLIFEIVLVMVEIKVIGMGKFCRIAFEISYIMLLHRTIWLIRFFCQRDDGLGHVKVFVFCRSK